MPCASTRSAGCAWTRSQKANSGHPGTPMGVAPVAYTLWQRFLRFDPADPIWPNRDRFVLSEGHASTLLWSLAPPGQGAGGGPRVRGARPACGDAGGPARRSASSTRIARGTRSTAGRAASRRRPGHSGRASRRQSGWPSPALAGGSATTAADTSHLRLRRLRPGRRRLHDGGDLVGGGVARRAPRRSRTCAGSTTPTGSRSRATPTSPSPKTSPSRFIAYGWNVTTVADANDLDCGRPRLPHLQGPSRSGRRLIVVHSHIGYGSPVEDSPKAHGEPFGVDGVRATKRFFGLPEDADFFVPDGVYEAFARGRRRPRGTQARRDLGIHAWPPTGSTHPSWQTSSTACNAVTCLRDWEKALPTFPPDAAGLASRDSSGQVLNAPGPGRALARSAGRRTCRRRPRPV